MQLTHPQHEYLFIFLNKHLCEEETEKLFILKRIFQGYDHF
jgi:hypothetical protein